MNESANGRRMGTRLYYRSLLRQFRRCHFQVVILINPVANEAMHVFFYFFISKYRKWQGPFWRLYASIDDDSFHLWRKIEQLRCPKPTPNETLRLVSGGKGNWLSQSQPSSYTSREAVRKSPTALSMWPSNFMPATCSIRHVSMGLQPLLLSGHVVYPKKRTSPDIIKNPKMQGF